MQIEVKKWGNSLALRIPKDLAVSLDIQEGQALELELIDSGLLIKTKRKRSNLSLEDMLKGLGTMEELDWGKAVGDEEW